uniref:Ig-like domain-containing protein n=1 Tax=Bos indicus x Bos taurus TaxID=30522 RepID=A0A4W2FG83_BOBOX
MAWMLLLLGLLAYGSGVEAQTVIQEPSLSVSPGGTVTLTCGLSSGSVTTYNEPSWYQQTPDQAPRNVIYNTNTRASGVPDRFSASISGNKATLTITGAQPEDEAEYHCLLYQGSGSYSCTVMGPHGEVVLKPAHVLGGSAFRGRRGRRGWKWSAPLWGRRPWIHLLSRGTRPRASCSLSPGVSRSPRGPLSP